MYKMPTMPPWVTLFVTAIVSLLVLVIGAIDSQRKRRVEIPSHAPLNVVQVPLVVEDDATSPVAVAPVDNGIESKPEKLCRDVIERYFGKPFPKMKHFVRNPLTKGRTHIELDGINLELRVAFEYQGEQHYHFPHPFWRNKTEFRAQRFRDAWKRRKCTLYGIHLIVIPYTAGRRRREQGGLERVLQTYLTTTFPDKGVSRLGHVSKDS